nr:IS6 family transposase [Sphingomonas phyllosphaerae]
MPRPRKPASPFRYFNSSPEVIRLVVLMYVRFPLSLRNVEDLLFERGIDICHETVRLWWNRFGPLFAGDIRRQRVSRMRGFRHWRWHLDEMYVKLNGEMVYLWRAVDHEGEVLESYVTRTRDKAAALAFMKKALKRSCQTNVPKPLKPSMAGVFERLSYKDPAVSVASFLGIFRDGPSFAC